MTSSVRCHAAHRPRRWPRLAATLAVVVMALLAPSTAQLRQQPSQRAATTSTPTALTEVVSDEQWSEAAVVPAPLNTTSPALLVHYTARQRAPDWRETAWRTTSGNQIVLRFYDDADSRALVALHRPHFLDNYDTALSPVERADYFRYLVLWAHGGLYVDSDIDFVRPVDQWLAHFGWDTQRDGWRLLETLDLVVGVEFPEPQTQYRATGWLPLQFTQFVFAGAARSDVLAAILDHVERCVAAIHRNGDVETTLERTGPAAFTRAILDEIAARGLVSDELIAAHEAEGSDPRYARALLPIAELEKNGQLVPLQRAAVTPSEADYRNRPYDLVLVLPYRAFSFHSAHGYAKAAELTLHRFENSWRGGH